MAKNIKKTRNCIEPWRSVHFEAGGTITPCCSGTITGDFGNINTDYFEALQRDRHPTIFVNADYQRLREGLLTGKLVKSCISCRSVHDGDITTDELRRRVMNHLNNQGFLTDGIDLTKTYAFSECGGNITNKCNFSCIYCAHSGESGHTGYFRAEMDRERFLSWVDFLVGRGLKIFNFCGIGELTIYPDWQELCGLLLDRYPQLRLRVISNFGKEFNDSELATLARLDLIHVSCDTLDADLYCWLRKGGRLPVLLENIRRLRQRLSGDLGRDPKLVFNVTATNAIVDKLEDLFRFAAENNMFVHISNLFVMQGSIASNTDCVKKISEMPDSQMAHIREILCDLPRRMKAQNPLSNVWEYKFLYNGISQKADSVTFNKFVPDPDALIYDSFYKTYPKDPHAHLRRIWLSFDDAFQGIYIAAGRSVKINLPFKSGKILYRAVWCRQRIDGNLDVLPGPAKEVAVSAEVTISALNCGARHEYMLFEVLSYQSAGETGAVDMQVVPTPPETTAASIIAKEAFLTDEEDSVAQRLVDSHEPLVIWCAGLRTVQILSSTCLGQANIKMIIDSNTSKKGQLLCGRVIHEPEDINGFTGKIVVIHASCPEQVESQIRQMGITNEILIL
jgi:molybdenum cofactor biosynthesis enzyme MoaA